MIPGEAPAIIPIGAYEPRKLMWMSHVTPEEAVRVGKEVRANTLIASHWGTINLSDDPQWEPPRRFRKAGLDNGFIEEALMVMKIGETRPLLLLNGAITMSNRTKSNKAN